MNDEKGKKKNTQTLLTGLIDKLEAEIKPEVGIITEINAITNSDFFGEDGMYGKKDGFAITVKIRDEKEDTEFTQWFSKPEGRGFKQTNMYAFFKRYKNEPKIGQQVDCHIDDNGFFRVTI